jgi:hypothetical protein
MSKFDDAGTRARFERAFVVTRHLLGHKPDDLVAGLQVRSAEAKRVVSSLVKGERKQRALVMAAEWGQVVVALSRRGFQKEPAR